jgi:hypothetical protein
MGATDVTDQSVHPDADRWGGWSWADPRRGAHFRTCNFCGCINPEDLAAEPQWRAAWADWKYGWPHKFYIELPNRNPERLFVLSSVSGGSGKPPAPAFGQSYVAWADRTPEQRAICEQDGYGEGADGWHPDYVAFGTRATHHAKFYSIHLADADLPSTVKATIEQRSGRAFHFSNGQIRWEPAGRAQKLA